MTFDRYMAVTDLMVYVGLLSEMPSPRQLTRDYNRKIRELKRSAMETQHTLFRHLEWIPRRDRWMHEMENHVVVCLTQTRQLRTDRLNRLMSTTTEEAQAVAEVDTSATVMHTIDEQPRSGASPPVPPNARPGTARRRSNRYRRESQRFTPY